MGDTYTDQIMNLKAEIIRVQRLASNQTDVNTFYSEKVEKLKQQLTSLKKEHELFSSGDLKDKSFRCIRCDRINESSNDETLKEAEKRKDKEDRHLFTYWVKCSSCRSLTKHHYLSN